MNDYQIALVIVVNQRGADASDAVDRVIANMSLHEGCRFTSPQPQPYAAQAGPACLSSRATVIMTKPLSLKAA